MKSKKLTIIIVFAAIGAIYLSSWWTSGQKGSEPEKNGDGYVARNATKPRDVAFVRRKNSLCWRENRDLARQARLRQVVSVFLRGADLPLKERSSYVMMNQDLLDNLGLGDVLWILHELHSSDVDVIHQQVGECVSQIYQSKLKPDGEWMADLAGGPNNEPFMFDLCEAILREYRKPDLVSITDYSYLKGLSTSGGFGVGLSNRLSIHRGEFVNDEFLKTIASMKEFFGPGPVSDLLIARYIIPESDMSEINRALPEYLTADRFALDAALIERFEESGNFSHSVDFINRILKKGDSERTERVLIQVVNESNQEPGDFMEWVLGLPHDLSGRDEALRRSFYRLISEDRDRAILIYQSSDDVKARKIFEQCLERK